MDRYLGAVGYLGTRNDSGRPKTDSNITGTARTASTVTVSVSKARSPPHRVFCLALSLSVWTVLCFCCSAISPAATPELPGQLAFTTSSSKKRKLSRNQARNNDDVSNTSSPDTVLPSCEPNDDPSFSFSAASTDGHSTPTYLRADSYPASSLPARLHHTSSFVSADYPDSTASSPCPVADLSIDTDRGPDLDPQETGTALSSFSAARSRSPYNVSRRAIMTSDANPHQRSSSPLKRRASSMDPDAADVPMRDHDTDTPAPADSNPHLPRAMS
ncbi:hypothetical protein LX36DRAFT_676276, partial [Colletotrichum falcatum]